MSCAARCGVGRTEMSLCFYIIIGIEPGIGAPSEVVIKCLGFIDNLFDSAHLARFQPHLDPVRVLR